MDNDDRAWDNKKMAVWFLFIFLLGCPPFAYSESLFKPVPFVYEDVKSSILKEQGVENPDAWRLVFVFRVKGEYRPKFFSSRQKYDIEAKVSVEESFYGKKEVYKGVMDFPNFTRTVILRRDDLAPLYAQRKHKQTEYQVETIFTEREIRIITTDKGKQTQKNVTFADIKQYYENAFLSFVLAAFPFNRKGPRLFNLFYEGTSMHYPFEARCLGVEQVKVPAGGFQAYRLRTNPTGFLSAFSQNDIWYRKAPPPIVVKGVKNVWWYVNETWELVRIDKESKEDHDH